MTDISCTKNYLVGHLNDKLTNKESLYISLAGRQNKHGSGVSICEISRKNAD